MLDSIKSGFDFARGKQVSDKKAKAKYIIFLAAFVFEDIGQVLIQEKFQHVKIYLFNSWSECDFEHYQTYTGVEVCFSS